MNEGVVILLSCSGGVVLLFFLVLSRHLYYRRINNISKTGSVGDVECTNTNTVTPTVVHEQHNIQTANISTYHVPVEFDLKENQVFNNKDHSEQFGIQALAETHTHKTRATSHYDYPKTLISISTSAIPQRPASYPLENIYENIQPSSSSITNIPQQSDASTSPQPIASRRPYNDVVFSITNETEHVQNSVQLNKIFKTKIVSRKLTPPRTSQPRNQRRNGNPYRMSPPHRPRFQFPYKTLVIATDATPTHIGGYFINHFSKRVEFYSVPSSRMPWILRNRSRSGNPTEFEMKNLLCALLLWEHQITRYKKVAIFTDNSAIIGNSVYGSRVRSFIHHLENCKQVLNVNSQWIFVNSKESPNIFNEFIIPADQLSRLDEPGFRSHIASYHYELHEGEISSTNFNAIRHKIMYWTRNSCPSCGFKILRAGSLKRAMQ